MIVGRNFASIAKKNREDKKICVEYKMEATIQSEMRLDKFHKYTAKEILGNRGRKSYM